MSAEHARACLLVLATVGILMVLGLLALLWQREQVKKDLRMKGLTPLRVRWRPWAYWSIRGPAFTVIYADAAGSTHRGRCWIPTLDRRVRWVSEEVGYLNKPLPLAGRVVYLLLVVFLLQFGVRHLLAGKLILPPIAKHPAPIRVDGWPLFLVCSAALCGAASLLTVVVYQYSSKAAERPYTLIARGCGIVGWALFASSPFVYLFQLLAR